MDGIIGKYINLNSFVHRIDPRLKIIINILYIVLFFISDHFITIAILMVPIFIAFIIATHRPIFLLRILKVPIIVGITIFIINIFILKISPMPEAQSQEYLDLLKHYNNNATLVKLSKTIFWQWSIIEVSYSAIISAVSLAVRIYCLIIVTMILTFSTKPILLTKAFEDLISPLKIFRIRTEIPAMILSIAMRFIPTILEEASRIMKAQASRGVDYKNGSLREKAKSLVTLTIPLFTISFSRAEDLANAMETRGYNPYQERTRYRKLTFKWFDYIILLFLIGTLIGISFLKANFNGIAETPNLPEWYQLTYQWFSN